MSALGGAIRSEVRKIRSVRSTYVTMAAAFMLTMIVGLPDTYHIAHGADPTGFDPVGTPFDGLQFAQLAFGVIGVLAASTEYATGMIRTTFAATPGRGTVFAAKAIVVGAGALVAGEILAFITYGAGQLLLSYAHLDVGLSGPGVLRSVSTAGLYLSVVAIVGLGLGSAVRHTAGAISMVFGVVFLTWPLARSLEFWSYLPDRLQLVNAATVLGQTHLPPDHVGRIPSMGFAYADLALYVAVAIGVGAWRMSRDV